MNEKNLVYEYEGVVDKLKKQILQLESENAELKKFMKYARDDKAIRLKEIDVLEAKIVELREIIAKHEHTIMVLRHLSEAFVDVKDDLQKLARDRATETSELREEIQNIADKIEYDSLVDDIHSQLLQALKESANEIQMENPTA